MAWLQSSFTSHQVLGNNDRRNLRKEYKVTMIPDDDPDNCDTPLLNNIPSPVEKMTTTSKLTGGEGNVMSKKEIPTQSLAGKASFLSDLIFDRRKKVMKTTPVFGKAQDFTNNKTKSAACEKKLLNAGDSKNSGFLDDKECSSSEDEWDISVTGYKKVSQG